MSRMISPRPAVKDVAESQDAGARLKALGFAPGAPRHITESTRRIDRASCRRRWCSECGNAGLEYQPFQSASGAYRALGVCLRCGHGEEF